MFVIIYDAKGRLGNTRLHQETGRLQAAGLTVGTRLGIPGLRGRPNRMARETRAMFAQLKDWVATTGYGIKVETTQREADALNGTYVMSNGGTYRLELRGGRVVTLSGHGAVS